MSDDELRRLANHYPPELLRKLLTPKEPWWNRLLR